jgi:endogenous inhibitor of DNA gyrase (YacG/DUF329 family)
MESQQRQTLEISNEVEQQPQTEKTFNVSLRRLCPSCGNIVDIRMGAFCPNCGANVMIEKAVAPIPAPVKQIQKVTGKCMICNLEIRESEEVLWCPFCGNKAHKIHLLEWLHVKNYCPICNSHLNEKELS